MKISPWQIWKEEIYFEYQNNYIGDKFMLERVKEIIEEQLSLDGVTITE